VSVPPIDFVEFLCSTSAFSGADPGDLRALGGLHALEPSRRRGVTRVGLFDNSLFWSWRRCPTGPAGAGCKTAEVEIG
jgi:hypothetical protein